MRRRKGVLKSHADRDEEFLKLTGTWRMVSCRQPPESGVGESRDLTPRQLNMT